MDNFVKYKVYRKSKFDNGVVDDRPVVSGNPQVMMAAALETALATGEPTMVMNPRTKDVYAVITTCQGRVAIGPPAKKDKWKVRGT